MELAAEIEAEQASLAETLGLEETYILVHETTDTEIYAHTIYYEVPKFDYDQFITEDETPVDNLFSEAQQRLSIDPLHANKWTDRDFMACSNVAVYYEPRTAPVVPDMFLSFDVKKPKEWYDKKNKCYFLWRMKKAPELVIEIVSNKEGNENTTKFDIYAKMGVLYYIIHDPYKQLYDHELNIFQLSSTGVYERYEAPLHNFMPEISLGLMMWEGIFEGAAPAPFIRWCDKEGLLLRTGAEGTQEEAQRADIEAQRADTESQRADIEAQRANEAEELAKKLAEEKEVAEQKALEAEAKMQALLKRLKDMGLDPLE